MNKLLTILNQLHPDVDFERSTHLVEDGILDSFDIVTLVAEIEDSFGVLISPEQLIPENFQSAAALYALIRELEA